MADKISKFVRTGIDIRPARDRGAEQADPVDQTGKSRRAGPARDSVQFRGQMHLLRAAAAGLRDLPDVDQKLVASLRAKVDSGDYEVDAERVAAKLLRLDQALG